MIGAAVTKPRPGRGTRHRAMPRPRPALLALLTGCGAAALAGCTGAGEYQSIRMRNDARLKPYEEIAAPGAPSTARPLPPGAVARGELPAGDPVRTGRSGGRLLRQFPIRITPGAVRRGQERFDIFCAPCHGRLGNGEGLVVQRGFPHPPDFAIRRLRQAPVGHFFDVMTSGYGAMYSYASRLPPADRWAVAAYIRALQASRPEAPAERYRAERIRARRRGIRQR